MLNDILLNLKSLPTIDENEVTNELIDLYLKSRDKEEFRQKCQNFLMEFVSTFDTRTNINPVLLFFGLMIKGSPNCHSYFANLLEKILLPLHDTNKWLIWDRQLSLLNSYHSSLCFTIEQILQQNSGLAPFVLSQLFNYADKSVNTSRENLLLLEIRSIFTYLREEFKLPASFFKYLHSVNSQLIQHVLSYFRENNFIQYSILPYISDLLPIIIMNLVHGGALHWNPTVNRQIANVLRILRDLDGELFDSIAETIPWKCSQISVSNDHVGDVDYSVKLKNQQDVKLTGCAPWSRPGASRSNNKVTLASFKEFMTIPINYLTEKMNAATGATLGICHVGFYDLVFGRELGEGASASVYYAKLITKGVSQSSWPELAVKKFGSPENRLHEVCICRTLEHPNICTFASSFIFKDHLYMVFEFCTNGDLFAYIYKHGKLKLDVAKFIFGEILSALTYIHDTGYAYCDMKTENILLTAAGHAKLSDFGSCRPLNKNGYQTISSLPEDCFSSDAYVRYDVSYLQTYFEYTPGVAVDPSAIVSINSDTDSFIRIFVNSTDAIIKIHECSTCYELRETEYFIDMDIDRLWAQSPPQLMAGHFMTRDDVAWSRRRLSTVWSVTPSEPYLFKETVHQRDGFQL